MSQAFAQDKLPSCPVFHSLCLLALFSGFHLCCFAQLVGSSSSFTGSPFSPPRSLCAAFILALLTIFHQVLPHLAACLVKLPVVRQDLLSLVRTGPRPKNNGRPSSLQTDTNGVMEKQLEYLLSKLSCLEPLALTPFNESLYVCFSIFVSQGWSLWHFLERRWIATIKIASWPQQFANQRVGH